MQLSDFLPKLEPVLLALGDFVFYFRQFNVQIPESYGQNKHRKALFNNFVYDQLHHMFHKVSTSSVSCLPWLVLLAP